MGGIHALPRQVSLITLASFVVQLLRFSGQMMINSCFQSFDYLIEVGLSGPRPPLKQPLKIGHNLTTEECSHWAWAAVQGNIPADYHNAWNYDWYAYRLLHKYPNSEVYALRVEHLQQDWSTIDLMLGGTGIFSPVMETKQNAADTKPLAIKDHNMTLAGTLHLCRALCDEIQVYKRLLLRAMNLQAPDVAISIAELVKMCPMEMDMHPRVCSYE